VWGDDRPLCVGQCHADQGYLPFGNLESDRIRFGNPQTSTGPSQLYGRCDCVANSRATFMLLNRTPISL
jgi:hypothetical protein